MTGAHSGRARVCDLPRPLWPSAVHIKVWTIALLGLVIHLFGIIFCQTAEEYFEHEESELALADHDWPPALRIVVWTMILLVLVALESGIISSQASAGYFEQRES